MTLREVNVLFEKYDVYRFISDCWGIFRVEGDMAVLYDIRDYLQSKEVAV